MAKAILTARAKEMGVKVEDVTVVVPFCGANVIEALIWLEHGARVFTVEPSDIATTQFRRLMSAVGPYKGRWHHIMLHQYCNETPAGDIVSVCHPAARFNLPFPPGDPRDIAGFGKDDAIYVIQSDRPRLFVRPFLGPTFSARYDALFYAQGLDRRNYFFSSVHVWFNERTLFYPIAKLLDFFLPASVILPPEVIIVKRDGTPTDGSLQRHKGIYLDSWTFRLLHRIPLLGRLLEKLGIPAEPI